MDYIKAPLKFKLKKTFRYIKIYGLQRTIAKIRGQYHMNSVNPRGNYGRESELKNVAIIGCGNYAFNVIEYYLNKYKGKVIRCTYDINENRAISLAYKSNAVYHAKTIDQILNDGNVKLVYIASNHYTHVEYAIEFLKKGKHVHIEKPHVVNYNQLQKLSDYLSLNHDSKINLGFNRPISEFGKIILRLLSKESGPTMINWFVAGHQIDPEHWYFSEKEGGRILGNLCHWTDFTLEMLGRENALPIKIVPTRAEKKDCDISVSFISNDSSIATITFSAKGHTFEGVRENLNLHKGDLLVRMNDYETLRIDKVEKKQIKRNFFRDHGHKSNILKSYDMLNNNHGENHEYIILTAKLFLSTKKAVEENTPIILT